MISIHWAFFRILSAKAISEGPYIYTVLTIINILTDEAEDKSNLFYLDATKCRLDVKHPVWASVGSNPTQTHKAVIKARLLSGSYTLQAICATFNQYQVNGQCP